MRLEIADLILRTLDLKMMSEAMEKVAGIREIPIFPLPLVLLPNEILPLHIFEPKYQQMLEDIGTGANIFGVTFFDAEQDFEKPNPGTTGCAAEIREAQKLDDGRSNILTNGLVRYRLIEYVDLGTPYFMADVVFFEDEPEKIEDLQPLADEVYTLFERIAKAAFKMAGNRGRFPEVPKAEPEPLSFLVTAAFNLENQLKYSLLEMTSTSERLERLQDILKQAVVQIEESADIYRISQTNGHSNKKLDL